MDFGKLSQLSRLNSMPWDLPSLNPFSVRMLSQSQSSTGTALNFFVGCPIWGQRGWIGKLYPPGTPERNFLKLYSRQFNTVELNTTFYRIPDEKTVLNWKNQVSPGFKFCPKVFQGISHESNLVSSFELFKRFCDVISHFENHLGPIFLQLPPYFELSQFSLLSQWIQSLPRSMELTVEFRNSSWFKNQQLHPKVFDLLASKEVGTVITDVAGRRDVLHGTVSSPTGFVRFVGNDLHPTDFTRIDHWVQKIGEWRQAGLKNIYIFVHQTDDTLAPDLASYLIRELNEKYHLKIQNWAPPEPEPQIEMFGS